MPITKIEHSVLVGAARDTARARRLVAWLIERSAPLNRAERDLLIACESVVLLTESEPYETR